MRPHRFEEAVALIIREDPRYAPDVYAFLRQALDFSVHMLHKPDQGPARHVSGQELLEGIRLLALQEFGPMARTVLASWGVTRTGDFGNIVFNLIEKGILGRKPEDKKSDFCGCYDFEDAFVKPFQPASSRARPRRPARRKRSSAAESEPTRRTP